MDKNSQIIEVLRRLIETRHCQSCDKDSNQDCPECRHHQFKIDYYKPAQKYLNYFAEEILEIFQ